ncbi:ferrochelatase [Membranicola marinus]|uniref:Ferrochelatase n=1 Tax=Membranihabitans marinus TaxID=1227546 RepID=A0A953HS30_9BACT|nr:ferrochelatase [Membranihabitans marinus]MBY5960214.1 ferrochelatase [Membranihabitans marinus]
MKNQEQNSNTHTGVLLINLGSPDSPKVKDVRKYLIEFLLDPRVIDIPYINRQLLVRGPIAYGRAPRSAEEYQKLWTEPDGSPLIAYGYEVRDLLQKQLGNGYKVELAMRYQSPSIADGINTLKKARLKKWIIVPLFPQQASATVGSVLEKVMEEIRKDWIFPELVMINQFYDRPDFIEAWAEVASGYNLQSYEKIIFSYHGLPQRQLFKADPGHHCKANIECCQKITRDNQDCYSAQCFHNTRLLREKLKLPEEKCITSFQSRLGRSEWIKPYTEDVVKKLAQDGFKKVLIISPAFIADCLETIVELGMEYKDLFIEHGGDTFDMMESLNANPAWIQSLTNMVTER